MPSDPDTTGRLIGIARRAERLVPMQEVLSGSVTVAAGLEGDHKGTKFPKRQITVLALEAWRAAASDAGEPDLPWTARRANFLVQDVHLPRAAGGVLRVGDVLLEVTSQTVPCKRMDDALAGLRKALHPDWRGGITCRVLEGGHVALGDTVEVLVSPPQRVIRLP
ncbi:MOSC domain-containing protein [Anderseniella sp. Alg231-50]|uniref:MOSC domain-containing protein n=1 Tax=Anderseniella sp. Alg231-50 TaxID=1922226 RepID=UPI00307C149A